MKWFTVVLAGLFLAASDAHAIGEITQAFCAVSAKNLRTIYENDEPPFSVDSLRGNTLQPLIDDLGRFAATLNPADRKLLLDYREYHRRSVRRIELEEIYWKNPGKWGNSLPAFMQSLPPADAEVLRPESKAQLDYEFYELDSGKISRRIREKLEVFRDSHDHVICRDGKRYRYDPLFCQPVRRLEFGEGDVISGGRFLLRNCLETWDPNTTPATPGIQACAEMDLLAGEVNVLPSLDQVFAGTKFGGKTLKGSLYDRYPDVNDYLRETLPAECTKLLGLKPAGADPAASLGSPGVTTGVVKDAPEAPAGAVAPAPGLPPGGAG